MPDATVFAELIDIIYDRILYPERWDAVLRAIEQKIGASSSYLIQHNTSPDAHGMNVLIERNVDADMRRSYLQHYITLNPVLPFLSSTAAGETYSCSHLVSRPQYLQSEFYQDWATRQDWFDYAGITLIQQPGVSAATGFTRAKPGNVFDGDSVEFLRRLAPHLVRVARIQQLLDGTRAVRADLTRLLGAARFGAMIVDADARIRYANPAAEILLARREGIGNEGGFLAAGAATKALRGALRASARRETASYTGRTLVAERGHGRRSLILHVIPVLGEERSTMLAVHSATALVFVVDPEAGLDGSIEMFGDAYRLTQAERRVLGRLATGDAPAEIAATLQISLPTVRTHLQRLYQKTRTRRQAELLTLLLQSTPQISQR